jgi:hypothetical protein
MTERIPAFEQASRELRLHGMGPIADWQPVVAKLHEHIRARDAALAAQRGSAKTKRWIGVAVVLIPAVFLLLKVHPVAGIAAAILGIVAVFLIVKLPKPDFIGTERAEFVSRLVQDLAGIAPEASIGLSAQLDSRHGVPSVALPGGLSATTKRGEREDAWLRGTLQGIPGLRLSWQATEWRTISLMRKKNARGKVKTKGKLALATRLAARLDADRALFTLNEQPPPAGNQHVDVRKTPRGFIVRGWSERSAKTALGSTDVPEALAELREKGAAEWFGDKAADLIGLMRLCELRLAPRAKIK